MKKIFAIIMAVLMIVSVFAGCNGNNNTNENENATKFDRNYADLGDNIVAMAGDYEITMQDMAVYIDLIVPYIQQSTGSSEGWEDIVLNGGLTARDELIDAAIEECSYQMAFVDYAKEQGIYTDEAGEAFFNEYIESLGGEDIMKEFLDEYGFERESMKKYMVYMGAYNAMSDHVCSDEEAVKRFNEQYITAKHVLVMFEGRSEEEALLIANSVHDKAVAGESFEALIEEFNEDPGQTKDGAYTFTAGEMVDEFYNGAKALNSGEISEPVKTSYGYHVIKRCDNPTDEEEIAQYISAIKSGATNDHINGLYEEILEKHPITINEGILSSIDLDRYTTDDNVNYGDGSVFNE